MLTLNQLGNKLKEMRENLGFSQDFVSKELGVTRQAIIAIESGRRKIDSFELFKLAKLYDFSVEDLMAGKEKIETDFQSLCLRNSIGLADGDKKALREFQNICKDYEMLKKI